MAQVKTFVNGPIDNNTYVLYETKTKDAYIVDPAATNQNILNFIKKQSLNVLAVLLTHCHWDHVLGLSFVRENFPNIDIYSDTNGPETFNKLLQRATKHGIAIPKDLPPPNKFFKDGDTFPLGNETIKIIHTPGHCPCESVFQVGQHLITGDMLFSNSVGRTDLPLSNPREMIKSYKKLQQLDPTLQIYPGHGDGAVLKLALQMSSWAIEQ